MSDISVAVRAKLTSDSTVTNLVSTRIYPSVLPQNVTLPAIRYETTTSRPASQLSGGAGFATSNVSIDIFGVSHIEAYNVQQAIRESLQDWTGTSNSVEMVSVQVTNIREDYLAPVDASDVGKYRVDIDVEILHEQTIPSH
jgi:hypothetical protein